MRFQEKSVIVTGGASGIGAATVKLFIDEGARVIIADTDPDGQSLAEKLNQKGQRATFVQTDVSKSDQAKHLIEETLRHHGRLDILHNNAGVLVIGNVTTISEADWDRTININLKSVYLVSKYAIPAMQKAGSGVIINTSSTAGISGGGGYSVYSASKAGIILLTQCMALDFAEQNIRVNAVCPGPTATSMILASTEDKQRTLNRWADELPIGRAGQPEDIAKAVAYLASEDAEFVTGTAFVVDGGRLLTGIGKRIAVDPN
ncbi:TPA: short-chain dehydrogenase [Candidatus Poribacteria bacterium]|jgi:NAD(P)-dependent dehydrogenase (short-subunit alcohol dehydrogenase family)|nr:SDR family oxidoreductase [Candidatus Poribacteria bacterium]HCK13541.1 short-chain dehydrogenase [Candidatus Poribacteria bacterium]|tara:strand:+ start:877 stop:1659 length:783 start_codon:yes stop_codon:yes gene_type:complete